MSSSISPNFWDGLSLDLELCSPVRLDLLVKNLLVSICLPLSMPAMELWTGSIQLSFYVGYKDGTQVLSSVYQALPAVQSPQHPVRWLLRNMCTTVKHAMNTRYVNFPGAVVSRAPQTKCIRTVAAYPCSVLKAAAFKQGIVSVWSCSSAKLSEKRFLASFLLGVLAAAVGLRLHHPVIWLSPLSQRLYVCSCVCVGVFLLSRRLLHDFNSTPCSVTLSYFDHMCQDRIF